jgi:hypothetical protein
MQHKIEPNVFFFPISNFFFLKVKNFKVLYFSQFIHFELFFLEINNFIFLL